MENDQVIPSDVVISGDTFLTRAQLETASYDTENNTVDVIFATDNPVLTRGFDDELFYEVLSFEEDHVRQDRLKSGLPCLDNHNRHGSVRSDVLGRTIAYKLFKNHGTATIKFSSRPELESFVKDVKDGLIVDVSAGYRVRMYRDITQPNDTYRRLLAVDWEPSEISMVPVPADYNTKVRSQEVPLEKPQIENPQNQEIHTRSMENENQNQNQPVVVPSAAPDAAIATKTAVEAERKRSLEITEVAKTVGLGDEFVTQHIEKGTTVDQVRALAIKHFADSKKQDPINGNQPAETVITVGEDKERSQKVLGLEEALTIRAFGSVEGGPKTDLGKRASMRHIHAMEHARGYVDLQFGAGTSERMTDMEMLQRALTSTDYPIAMANVVNKSLDRTYKTLEPVWKKFATKVTANDFKDLNSVQVSGSFLLDELTEQGEYKEASFMESGDKWNLRTWGKMIKLSRKMIINDDLGAFQNTAPRFAQGYVNRQTKIVYDLLTGNNGQGRKLGRDGKYLFDSAAHNNYASPGAVMSLNAFNLARVAMSRQKDPAGDPIAVSAKYLVVPPELRTLAEQLINSTIVANETSQTNPFKGAFEILEEPYLEDSKAWYLVADPSAIDVVKYAVLAGQEGLFTEHMYDFNTDELKIKVRGDFNATIEEHRGIYKNVGGN